MCAPPGTVKSSRRRAQFEEALDRRAIAMIKASRAARGMPPPIFSSHPGVNDDVEQLKTLMPDGEDRGVWQEYRRTDLGFRVEMPGVPQVETEQDDLTRSVDAHVDYEQTRFAIYWQEWSSAQIEEELDASFRERMRAAGMAVNRETYLVMSGVPAREFVHKSDDPDDVNYIMRHVVMGKETIAVNAIGGHGIHNSPTVRRFLDSFALLRGAR
jgi:hypothetical protein